MEMWKFSNAPAGFKLTQYLLKSELWAVSLESDNLGLEPGIV